MPLPLGVTLFLKAESWPPWSDNVDWFPQPILNCWGAEENPHPHFAIVIPAPSHKMQRVGRGQ